LNSCTDDYEKKLDKDIVLLPRLNNTLLLKPKEEFNIRNPFNVPLYVNIDFETNLQTHNCGFEICNWMLRGNNIACWLDWYSFKLYEPINVIYIDFVSETAEESKQKVKDFLYNNSYMIRSGSSTGYYTIIEDEKCKQSPSYYVWSDNLDPKVENNHARIFFSTKPSSKGDIQYYISAGSFSREAAIKHNYISFEDAKNSLTATGEWKESNIEVTSNVLNYNSDFEDAKDYNYSTVDHTGIRIFYIVE
jgi:hypothetical protein